jgi:hypothetical protein
MLVPNEKLESKLTDQSPLSQDAACTDSDDAATTAATPNASGDFLNFKGPHFIFSFSPVADLRFSDPLSIANNSQNHYIILIR